MKILILEDDNRKLEKVSLHIKSIDLLVPADLISCECWSDFLRTVEREKYDLIIADLMVPFHEGMTEVDVSEYLIQTLKDFSCTNYGTPAIALTGFQDIAEESWKKFNKVDISVVNYAEDDDGWMEPLAKKIVGCCPPVTYDFVIVCALRKERNAYESINSSLGKECIIDDISCRKIEIGQKRGLVVIPKRMGLVSCAVASTKVIERFNPRIIAMSGICAGLGDANIYDIIIPEVCYQHDGGKWTEDGFEYAPYQVALENGPQLVLDQIIHKEGFFRSLSDGITVDGDELPDEVEELTCEVMISPLSSGSAVVGAEAVSKEIQMLHRKAKAFEMEAYALYESAHSSAVAPLFFAAKCVVDNGNSAKDDKYHRVACLLSAKAVSAIIDQLD